MRNEVDFLSCAPATLYEGAFRDSEIGLDRLIEVADRHAGAVEVIGEVFPGAAIARPPPVELAGPDRDFTRDLSAYYAHVAETYTRIGPALLVRIPRAIVWRNMLYAVADDRVLPVYELYRPVDRAEKGPHLVSRLAACPHRATVEAEGRTLLFVGSAGSFNYGHWLVDDFPAYACADALRRPGADLTVLMSGYHAEIDRVRTEGAAVALGERSDYRVRYLDRAVAYTIENLHYVTPVSYHPVSKNPHAVAYVRSTFEQAAYDAPRLIDSDRLFVNRGPELPRRIANNDAVVRALAEQGYREFFPEGMSLREQWAVFAGARHVVGIMGAGMTGSVLCPPGSHLTYLAPTGWNEPFFWDLAAMGRQRYRALFGPIEPSEHDVYRKSFTLDPDLLADRLARDVPRDMPRDEGARGAA